jgi:hypothetical protein
VNFVNEVRSPLRVVRLTTPPPPPRTMRVLYVPSGSSDAEVVRIASEVLDPTSLAELVEIIKREAAEETEGSAP